MDLNAITQAISVVGFPIVAVIGMGFFIWNLYKASEKREERLMTEITENRKINAEAIKTIATYADKLDTIQTDINEIKTDITVIMSKQ